MKRLLLVASFFLASTHTQNLHSQVDSHSGEFGFVMTQVSSDSLLRSIRASLLDSEFQHARNQIDALALTEDGLFAARFHSSFIDFLRSMLEQTDEVMESYLENSRALENELGALNETKWSTLMRAELKLQQAFVHARMGNNFRAALSGRKAFNLFKKNVEKFPDHWDSYKGLGIVQMMVGSVPSSYRRILSILGFDGSVAQGLQSLAIAAEKGQYFSDEAQLYLALADVTVNQSKLGSMDRLDRQLAARKNSTLIALLKVYALQSSRNAEAVIKIGLPFLETARDEDPYLPINLYYYMGDAAYKLNQLDKAIGYLEIFVKEFKGKSLLQPALVKLGQSYELLGERQRATEYYQAVLGDSEFDIDVRAKRIAEERIKNEMSHDEKTILLATNYHDAGKTEAARELFVGLLDEGDATYLAQINYMLGRGFHHEGKLQQARIWYHEAIAQEFDSSQRWIPWARFYIGELSEQLGQLEMARQSYHDAKSYKGDFDFKRSLEQKSKAALERIDKRQKEIARD